MMESGNAQAGAGSDVETDVETDVAADVATTLATIRALTEVQERMRIHFERERPKLIAERPARASKAKEERRHRAPKDRASCLRVIRKAVVRLVLLAVAIGFLLIMFDQAVKLARSIDGALAP